MASDRRLQSPAQQSKKSRGEQSAPIPQAERRIAVLDGWRGVSILLVIGGHLLDYRYVGASTSDFQYRLVEVVSTGGVCIFFTISGFIIVSLAIQEHDRTGGFWTVGFYIRRCFRILPPFWAYVACVAVLGARGFISQRGDQTLLALGFVCNLPRADCGHFAGHVWSLAYEEQFYILLPFLMWWQRPRTTLPILLVCLISVPFLGRALHLGHIGFLAAHGAFYFSLICAGAFCAAYRDLIKRLATMRGSNYASAAAIVALLGMWVLDTVGRGELARPILQHARADVVPLLEPLCIAWLVAGSVYQSSYLTRFLEWAPLNLIGTISFSLYL